MEIADKKKMALEACNKVINGIEDGTLSVESALLLCKKVARLVNDTDAQEWLDYEYGGYPCDDEGKIISRAWSIAFKHGRVYHLKNSDGKISSVMFSELCGELESLIESSKKAISNYSTQGYSVSGEYALLATDKMAKSVAQGTTNILRTIKDFERHLSILRSQYYDYAVCMQIELQFANVADTIFQDYQKTVDGYFSSLPITVLQKLNAIEDMMSDKNPEKFSQVITSCRRLWEEVADYLFNTLLPNYSDVFFVTKSGKKIDITNEHYNNKLSAAIETAQSKSVRNTLVGSEIVYLIDWINQINDIQNSGVHNEVTKKQAMRCVIHTYIALGDILSLCKEYYETH